MNDRIEFDGNISLSFPTNSSDLGRTVRIVVEDEGARVKALEINLTLEKFALLMSGLSYIKTESASICAEGYVGKTKVVEKRQRKIPSDVNDYDRRDVRAWLQKDCQEEGWILDASLSSQGSVVDGVANYSVSKWVDKNGR